MFQDKNLEKVFRQAQKGAGIDIIFDDEQVVFLTANWMAVLPRYRLTEAYRQTLGAIVEALGYIPEREILHVIKGKDEYMVTHPLPEVVSEDIASYCALPGDAPEQIKNMGLYMSGWWLYQKKDNTIYGLHSGGPDLGIPDTYINEKGTLFQTDENTGEEVYRRTDRPREDASTAEILEAWAYMEGRRWCPWECHERQEIEGQEELDTASGEEEDENG